MRTVDKKRKMEKFTEELVRRYRYRPIPQDSMYGNVRDIFEENLPEWCLNRKRMVQSLYTADGARVCEKYQRILISDYGAFIEISPEHICKKMVCTPGEEYRLLGGSGVRYLAFMIPGEQDCKIRFQIKKETFGKFKPGMFYVSPYEVFPGVRKEEKDGK